MREDSIIATEGSRNQMVEQMKVLLEELDETGVTTEMYEYFEKEIRAF